MPKDRLFAARGATRKPIFPPVVSQRSPARLLNRVLLLALTSTAVAAAIARGGEAPVRLFVSGDGNDAWSGKLAAPKGDRTDGPLASLEGARDVIRRMKQSEPGLPPGGVEVCLRGGIYARTAPLVLNAQDSGTDGSPIVYRAAPGETARLIGGVAIDGFQEVRDAYGRRQLSAEALPHVRQVDLKAHGVDDYGQVKQGGLELFFENRPMTIARGPEGEVIRIAELRGGDQVQHRDGTMIDRIGKFTYQGDYPKRWAGEKEIWLHGYWYRDWAEDRHLVKLLDTDQRYIEVEPPYHRYGYRKNQWFYGLNMLAELDRPGEWYLDRDTGVLYFWPPAPIDPGDAVVSVIDTMLTLRDVNHVTVRDWVIEACRGTAITIAGGKAVTLAGCTIRNTGSWAVRIGGGEAHRVQSCDIAETGDGGVAATGGDRAALKPAGHQIVNNHFWHFSRWNRMCRPAVQLGGVGNRIAHNLMHDAPHQAISFSGNEHIIELNEIHHVCYESNDAGAIYAGYNWTMRGTVIRHNFMHHVRGLHRKGCVGVYLDDMYSGTTISGNVFFDVFRPAFIGGGRDNTITNNLFVECPRAIHVDARAMGWASAAVEGKLKERLEAMPYDSPPWRERYPRLPSTMDDQPAAPKGNRIACNVLVDCQPWDDIFADARPFVILENIVSDFQPDFIDRASLDFGLANPSVLGEKLPCFEPIPFERIGLYRDEYRIELPEANKP